jgi:MSHA biogenesis protein MshO
MNTSHHQAGFTLIELIVSMVLISLLALVAAPMLRLPLSAWLDASRRAELTNAADTVHSKLADDLRRALPNSVRVRQVGARVLLETLEVRAWGRHRAGPSGGAQVCPAVCAAAGAQDVLEAACSETCFTSIGPLEGDVPVAGSDWVVVNPLTPAGAVGNPYFGGNVAVAGGIKTRLTDVSAAPDGNRVRIAAHNFAATAASRRFYLVATPVTWDCDPATQRLTRRWGYAVAAVQPVAFAAAAQAAPLATQVAACSIRYVPAGSQGRGGIVHVVLRLSQRAADTQVPENVDLVTSLPVSEGP